MDDIEEKVREIAVRWSRNEASGDIHWLVQEILRMRGLLKMRFAANPPDWLQIVLDSYQ